MKLKVVGAGKLGLDADLPVVGIALFAPFSFLLKDSVSDNNLQVST